MSQLRLLQMGGSLGSPAYQVKTASTPCEYPNAEGCRGSQAEDGRAEGEGSDRGWGTLLGLEGRKMALEAAKSQAGAALVILDQEA